MSKTVGLTKELIDAGYLGFSAEYKRLKSRDHGFCGRFLTCHLLLEHFLRQFFCRAYPTIPKEAVKKLRFSQLLDLAERPNPLAGEMLVPALKYLNKIRNKLAHDLEFVPTDKDLEPIKAALSAIAKKRKLKIRKGIELIEDFTDHCCGVLGGLSQLMQKRYQYTGILGMLDPARGKRGLNLGSEDRNG